MRTGMVGRCKRFCRGQARVLHLQGIEDSLLNKIGPTQVVRDSVAATPRGTRIRDGVAGHFAHRPAGRGEHRGLITKTRTERVIELDLADAPNGLLLAPRRSIPKQLVAAYSRPVADQVAKPHERVRCWI